MFAFDPDQYKSELVAIVSAVDGRPRLSQAELERILRKHPRDGCGFFSKSEIISGYRRFATELGWQDSEREFVEKMKMKPVRTQSGVAPVTVLTKPFPCPGTCIFCPNDVRMPKSYLSDEPGAQRAARHAFDPYVQTYNRLESFDNNGHAVDKVELLILGGTWSYYPESYQRWFVKRCFDAMNDYGSGRDRSSESPAPALDYRGLTAGEPLGLGGTRPVYNQVVAEGLRAAQSGELLADWETAEWSELEDAHAENESARCRNVGLVLETRPDALDDAEVLRLRRLGCTKVQIGYQSLSDRVLELNGRGHTTASTRRAMELLRGAGFKVLAHWMPNLYGSSVAADIEDFGRVFGDPAYRPDELKLYPCSLIETAELMRHYRAGRWRPYAREELLELLVACFQQVPQYCRLSRVIRDIPSTDIVDGNKATNFRQVVEAELERRGRRSLDIRAREIGLDGHEPEELTLVALDYDTTIGRERFLQFVTPEDRIVGFLRLSLPASGCAIAEISASALVRELHVYGAALAIGESYAPRPQHSGLGARLLDEAAELAAGEGYDDLAVISAIGTRGYYRKQGFVDGALYQHRSLRETGP